jgi:hypothetical protein
LAELREQVKRNRKNSRVKIATGSTMVLDSSGSRDDEWLWEMRSAIVAGVRDRNSMEVADDLGHRFWRLLPYGRQWTKPLARRTLRVWRAEKLGELT